MSLSFRLLNSVQLGFIGVALHAATTGAQEPQPAVPVEPGPAVVTAPSDAAAAPQAAAVAPPEVALPPAPLPPEPAPAEPAPAEPGPLKLGAWTRIDFTVGNSAEPKKLNDLSSSGEFEFHASGNIYKSVSLTTNFVATYNAGGDGTSGLQTGKVGVMDGIVQIEPSEFFNIWLGRMLVPVDRANFAGPYFMAPWLYPGFGFADGQVGAPHEGPFGRNDGATVWGQVGGGMFKYFAGVFDLQAEGESPLFSGRVSLSLLNPEPGYWGTATYHGLDVLGIGVGVQAKKNGSVPSDMTLAPSDYSEFNADVLFEKTLGGGVLDLEAAFYKFNGDYERTDASWYGLASFILPGDVAGGKLQPLLRVQQAIPAEDAAPTSTLVDAQIAYIVNSYATLFTLGYRNGKAGDEKLNQIYFGAQIQK